jgi:hypothetical protein
MKKPLLAALWEGVKILTSMFFAISFMRFAVYFGATPLEAGFSVVVAAVLAAAFIISRVMGAAGDSFHPKVDGLLLELSDIRRQGE